MNIRQPTAVIADDANEMRALLHKTLESIGCEVVAEATTGEEAIQAIEQYKPDMVFLDIEMPDKTGLEVLMEIQALGHPVYPVMISGHSSFDNVKKALSKGAKGFVVKPYTFSKVSQIVENFIEQRQD
jgi:two-component system chemotaxis response regulator CheY